MTSSQSRVMTNSLADELDSLLKKVRISLGDALSKKRRVPN